MNRTITTSTTRRRRLRLRLRPAALALVALAALVAASCTADPLAGTDTPASDAAQPDVLTFNVAPRPAFTEAAATRSTGQEIAGQARNDKGSARNSAVIPGLTRDLPNRSTAPATRAGQTDNGTRWQQGDILWLDVAFYRDKQDADNTFDSRYISALKYDGAEWRYLTETEAEDLNTGNIPGFSRLVRWPRGLKEWVDPGMQIIAFYAGSGKPGADGTITITPQGEIPTMPLIQGGSGICSPDGKPVLLHFGYTCSRVRIPAGYRVELTGGAFYYSTIGFSLENGIGTPPKPITEILAQSGDTDVFLSLDWSGEFTAKLTRDGVSPCIFNLPLITDAEGYTTRDGLSYTLTPYTSGSQTPVEDYDLTVGTEAQLRDLARAVNAGERLPNGKSAAEARVLQTADIHLTQGEWVPIGSGFDKPFRGAYNGNGNEISGLTITTATQPDVYDRSFAGLFGYVDGAVLTGIRLREVGINITQGNGARVLSVGSIAGWLDNSTLSLCTADGTVNAGGVDNIYAGGIAGLSWYGTISRCRADVETKAATTRGWANAGGIAGQNGTCNFILSCEIGDRAVTAEGVRQAYAGGIAGYSLPNTIIATCRTGKNTVTARNGIGENCAGGLVGKNGGVLASCYSRATAEATGTGSNGAGAIVGYNGTSGGVDFCYGTGATDKGTSNLDADPNDGIVYNANPASGDIYNNMAMTPKFIVDDIDDGGGKTYYVYTTHYDPSATPAYGIIPQRAVWQNGNVWKQGADLKYPEINMDYEGE